MVKKLKIEEEWFGFKEQQLQRTEEQVLSRPAECVR
jgi:hypothetical protein